MQTEHHTGTSLFEELGDEDMVHMFVLNSMHYTYIGVAKRLLGLWESKCTAEFIEMCIPK